MPIVPRVTRQVTPEPLPGVRRSPAAPEGAFGGVRPPDLAPLADATRRIAEEAKQHADQIAVLDTDRQAGEFQQGLLDPVNGALSKRGKDAMTLPEDVGGAWDEFRSSTLSRLTNDDQRLQATRMLDQRGAEITATVNRHVAEQARAYDDDTTTASVALATNEAAQNADDPAKALGLVAKQRAIIADYAKRNGLSPEDTAERQLRASSATHSAVLTQLLDQGKDLAAQKYFAQVHDQLTAADSGRVQKSLEQGSVLGEGQRQSDAIVARATSLDRGLAEAAKITDPRVREETEKQVVAHFEHHAASIRQAQVEAYTRASKLVEQGQDVPLSLRTQMDAQDNRLLYERASQIRKQAAGLGDSDPDLYLQLRNTAHASPAFRRQFAHLNLGEFKPYLNVADYKALLREQEQALGEGDTEARGDEKAQAKAAAITAQRTAMIAPMRAADSTQAAKDGKPFNPAMWNQMAQAPHAPGGPMVAPPWAQFAQPAPAPAASPATPARPGHPTVPETYLQHAQRDPAYAKYLTGMGIIVPTGT